MAEFDNVISYSLQLAVLAAAGLAMPFLLRLRAPRTVHGYLQAVLALCLLLPLVQPWREMTRSPSDVYTLTATAGGATAVTVPGFLRPTAILAILAAGVVLRLLWLAAGLWRLRMYRRRSRPIEDLPAGILQMQARLRVDPRFYGSAEVIGPVTFGLFRPVVLVPENFLTMDAESREAVACHELLHVRRRDWAFTLAEEIIRSLFWFHPPLLWLIERIRATREQIVDGLVVRWTGARRHYVQALLSMASVPARADLLAPSFARKHHLKERVALLLKESSMSKGRLTLTLAVIGLGTVSSLALAVSSFPLSRPAAADRVYRINEGVVGPKLLSKTEPEYTQQARDSKVQGTVVLYAEVSKTGAVENIKVVKGLDSGLDANAIAALKQWKFEPGTKDGKRVRVAATIEINFRLE
jgi:TonB family protein